MRINVQINLMKYSGLFILFTFSISFSGRCQNSIIASQVESWTVQSPVSSDYNLNSSYIFLLNPALLSTVFEGEGLNKGEKKDVGIKKGTILSICISQPVLKTL